MSGTLKSYAYALAGFSMMLNIRLCYSSAPYALIRFRLPENLFSVFVRRMASSLELWCLPSMCLGNIMDFARKRVGDDKETKKWLITYHSIFWCWANFLTFVILLFVYIPGDQGHLTTFYWVIAASGFVFGIYMVLVYAVDGMQLAWYMIGENSFPMLTSLIHYVATLMFGNRRKYNSDFIIVLIDIWVAIVISLAAAVLWTIAYHDPKDDFGPPDPFHKKCLKNLQLIPGTDSGSKEYTINAEQDFAEPHAKAEDADSCGLKSSPAYWSNFIPPSLMVLVGMGLVYMIYPGIAPGMIVPFYLIDKIEMVLLIATAFPPVIIGIMKSQGIYDPYVFMGNWGGSHKADKANGYLRLTPTSGNYSTSSGNTITLTISSATYKTDTASEETPLVLGPSDSDNKLLLTSDGDIATGGTHTLIRTSGSSLTLTLSSTNTSITTALNGKTYNVSLKIDQDISLDSSGNCTSCKLKTTSDTGGKHTPYSLGTYSIIVSGKTITGSPDNNDMHSRHKGTKCCMFGNQNTWSTRHPNNRHGWHSFTILIPLKITLAIIFVYCLHHPDSSIARSIINQPKMSTALSIIFYMCHECLLAVGFAGIAPNDDVILPMQLIGAFLMVLPAMYSEGYLIEYKSHDPQRWPTTGMKRWVVFFCWYCFVVIRLISLIVFIMIKFNVCSDGYCDFK